MIFFRLPSRILFIIISAATVYSCTEQKVTTQPTTGLNSLDVVTTDNTTSTIQISFSKTVGSAIDSQTGLRWIRNFNNSKPSTTNGNYFIQAGTLKGIMSNGACVGISLFYAIDNSGQLLIIPIGINVSGKVITTQSISVQSAVFNWQTAWQWINSYSGKVKSHFFGTETFNRLLIDQNSSTVRISLALDDSGNPQLLLSNASLSDPTTYEDKSSPCPPVCPN